MKKKDLFIIKKAYTPIRYIRPRILQANYLKPPSAGTNFFDYFIHKYSEDPHLLDQPLLQYLLFLFRNL